MRPWGAGSGREPSPRGAVLAKPMAGKLAASMGAAWGTYKSCGHQGLAAESLWSDDNADNELLQIIHGVSCSGCAWLL